MISGQIEVNQFSSKLKKKLFYKGLTKKTFVLIAFHSLQSWTTTAKHGNWRKRRRKGWKGYRKAVWKEPKEKKCLLTLDLKTSK